MIDEAITVPGITVYNVCNAANFAVHLVPVRLTDYLALRQVRTRINCASANACSFTWALYRVKKTNFSRSTSVYAMSLNLEKVEALGHKSYNDTTPTVFISNLDREIQLSPENQYYIAYAISDITRGLWHVGSTLYSGFTSDLTLSASTINVWPNQLGARRSRSFNPAILLRSTVGVNLLGDLDDT